MASSTTNQTFDDELSCAVCLDLFTDPRLLTCLHSFCAQCLKDVQAGVGARDGAITCPVCRAVTSSTVDALPPNRPLRTLAKAMKAAQKSGGTKSRKEVAGMTSTAIKALFMNDEASVLDHHQVQSLQYSSYCAMLQLLLENQVKLGSVVKARVLAATWARRDHELADVVLNMEGGKGIGLPEMLRTVMILDCSRQIRQHERRLQTLRDRNAKAPVLGECKATLFQLKSQEACGSLSGALKRRVKKWCGHFTPEELEFFVMMLPAKPWRQLADIVHVSPRDFQLDWFLPCCFGVKVPGVTSLAMVCATLTLENMPDLLREHKIPYSFIRKKFDAKDVLSESRGLIAQYTPLDQILWYYEDLVCRPVNQIIYDRLKQGETPDLAFGKLLELVLTTQRPKFQVKKTPPAFVELLQQVADKRLKEFSLAALPSPVLVIGDCSASMQVCVMTSAIISGLACSLCDDVDLRFFNNRLVKPAVIPRTVGDVIKVANTVKACRSTIPAVALKDLLAEKKVFKSILMVTDEEENGKCDGMNFAQIYKKYCADVFPAKLIFMSFLRKVSDEGQMMKDLRTEGITGVQQFKFDQKQPNLSRLDSVLSMLAASSDDFSAEASKKAVALKKSGELNKNTSTNNKPSSSSSSSASGASMKPALLLLINKLVQISNSRASSVGDFNLTLSKIKHVAASSEEFKDVSTAVEELVVQAGVLKPADTVPADLKKKCSACAKQWKRKHGKK